MVDFDIYHITERQLAELGLSQIAYVKQVTVDGEACFAIHAADGTPLALSDGLASAVGAIIDHDMVPTMVH